MSKETIQIMLNSKTANSYINGTTDCIFILPPIELKKRHKAYISVVHSVIPHSFYNVNSTNNILNYFVNSGSIVNYSVTIPPANYNISTLIAKLEELMIPGFNITYNSTTNKVRISHDTYPWGFLNGTNCEELLGIILSPIE